MANNKRKQVRCPECGRLNIGSQTECLLCNAQLTDTQNSKSDTAASAAHSSLSCHACGAFLAQSQRFCTNCGVAVSQEKILHCSSCGAETTPEQKFCIKCGQQLIK